MTYGRVDLRRGLIGATVTWYLGTTLIFAVHPFSSFVMAWISGLSLAAAALGAGGACLFRARGVPHPRIRAAWFLLGAAASAWGLGQVVTCVYELLLDKEIPSPSLADLGYLLAVPLFAAGLLAIAVPANQLATRLRAVLDGLLISVAALLTSWTCVLGPVAHSSADSALNKAILLAYPSGDVVLVTFVAYVVLRVRATGVRPGVPLAFIATALVGFAIADSGYAYLSLVGRYESGSVIDAGWLGGFTLLLVACMLPRTKDASDELPIPETRPLGMLLPYFFIVLGTVVSVVVTEITGHRDNTTKWIRTSLILLMVVRQVITLQENSSLTRTLEQRVLHRTAELEASKERFRALVEHSSDVVSLLDDTGYIVYQSDSSLRVFGVPSAELLGTQTSKALDDASRARFDEAVAEVKKTPARPLTIELRLLTSDGRWRHVESTLTNLLADPAVNAIVLNSRDVSERRELESELTHQAFHDSLTGLANRALFLDRVRHAMRRRTDAETVGVLFLDLDGFKEVNDSLGHATGDALLVTVATRLTDCLRPGDTIARLGGDEFAILVEGAQTGTEFTNAAERIREALEPAVVVDGRSLFIRASVGIATAEIGMVDADQLIRNADLAMYQAKERRDGEFALYDPSMHSTLVERLALEAELRTAVSEGLMKVHYQPTYTLDQGALVGVEALLRWTHPERGEIAPDVFIPLAEQTGLIHELGRFVLREACLQGQRWRELAPDTVLTIGVNVSTRQLQRATFAEEVREALAESGFPAKHLILEMTESVLMNDTDSSLATLKELKAMGLRIAIDDFGTGYSSLSYLHRFPVDILKIDRSFIERLSDSDARDSLVQSIVQLGHTLQLETVAEGIEDNTQLQALRRLGCEMAQGFHFGRPGPPDEVANLLMLASSSADVSDNPAATSVNPADAGKIPGQRPAAELSVRSGGDGE